MPDTINAPNPLPATGHSQVVDAIARAAEKNQVDFGYLFNEAKLESNLNADAHARTSSAAGLYQFTNQTWLGTVKEHGAQNDLAWASDAIVKAADGRYRVTDASLQTAILALRQHPDAAAAMAAASTADSGRYLAARLGYPAAPTALYLAHFLGPAGAANFMTALTADPAQAAAPLFPQAARANRGVFYGASGSSRTLAEIYRRFEAALDNTPAMPVAPASADLGRDALPVSVQRVEPPVSPAANQRERDWAGGGESRLPPKLTIEPLPHHLSLAFAQRTYQRLAALGTAA